MALADEKLAGAGAGGRARDRRPGLPHAPPRTLGPHRRPADRPPRERARARGRGVSELAQPAERFADVARAKLADAHIQGALGTAQRRLYDGRERAWAELPGRRGAPRARP